MTDDDYCDEEELLYGSDPDTFDIASPYPKGRTCIRCQKQIILSHTGQWKLVKKAMLNLFSINIIAIAKCFLGKHAPQQHRIQWDYDKFYYRSICHNCGVCIKRLKAYLWVEEHIPDLQQWPSILH